MKMTAELSVYPLREDFKTAVLGFIDGLLKGQDVVAVTNSMRTQMNEGSWAESVSELT